ncbi:MAG: DNA primase [Gemmatimonadetes bacterium]|nr:DNA primase [Gemmatimonadota bacterium]
MGIPDAVIEEVRQRGDLVELVGEHTRLKRAGRTFRGPCPLHGGEGPNFSVDPQKGFFHCFVCGEGGDIFAFPMKHLGMDFLDAVRYVAERAGVEIPDPREEAPQADPNQPLYDANAFAADWYRRQLESDTGRVARDYLRKRGIGGDVVERFRLGWAPEAWTAFGDVARSQGIRNEQLLAVDLVKEPKQPGREPYDALRGRVIFPIEDLGGRVIAFGGRVLDDSVPKYLNSPDSPIYHKGQELYGLGWSRGAIRRAETALVVEGYMDYVSLAAHGVPNVVAPLGTALTPEQAERIARYAQRAILLYDSDKAGLRATFRSGDALLRAGVEVLVATLPKGEDPDSLVRSKGGEALKKYLDDAVDVLERKIQILELRDFFGSIAGTRRAIDLLIPTIRAASDEVLRGVYLRRISEKTGVPQATLEREVADVPARDTRPPGAPDRRARQEGRRAEDFGARQPIKTRLGPERSLLLLLLRDDTWAERLAREVSPEDFRDPVYRRIYEGLLHTEGRRDAEAKWLENFPPEVQPVIEDLRASQEAADVPADEFFDANLRSLLARPLEDRLREIDRELAIAPAEQYMELIREQQAIRLSMRERNLPIQYGVTRQVLPQ